MDVMSLAGVVGRTLVVYAVVLVGLRVAGKREVGQMTPFDLVLLLLLANAVQEAMIGNDTSLAAGIAAVLTLFGANAVVARVTWRSRRVRTWFEGSPRILVRAGRVLRQNMTDERVTADELNQALREHGVANVQDVALAVLEVDGSISVLREDEISKHGRPARPGDEPS